MNRKIEKECECTLEYILPDYKGDIKRVLTASAKGQNDGKFVGEDGVEVSGNVIFDVIYLDANGEVSEFNTNGEYTSIMNFDMSGYDNSLLESTVTSFNYRVTGPRKISLKAKILNSLDVNFTDEGEKCDFEGAECEKTSLLSYCPIFAEKRENEYNEDFNLDERGEGNIEIISSFGNVKILSAEVGENYVNIKGEYIIGAIVKENEDNVFVIKKSIPFDERVDVEGVYEGMPTVVSGTVTTLNVSMKDDLSRGLNLNFTSDLAVKVGKNKEKEIVSDGYYENYNSVAEYEMQNVKSVEGMEQRLESVSFFFDNEKLGNSEIRDILALNAQVQNYELVSGELTGNIAFSGVACEINDDGESVYSPLKLTTPFTLKVAEGNLRCNGTEREYSLKVVDTDFTVGDGGVYFTVLLEVKEENYKASSVKKLKSLEKSGEEYQKDKSVYTVYFPEKNETLFEVAKKFSSTRERLARDNSLTEDAINSHGSTLPKRLIIS